MKDWLLSHGIEIIVIVAGSIATGVTAIFRMKGEMRYLKSEVRKLKDDICKLNDDIGESMKEMKTDVKTLSDTMIRLSVDLADVAGYLRGKGFSVDKI